MHKHLLAALLAGTIATPAFAQDAGPFSGLRVEAIAGYDRVGSSDNEDEDDNETIGGVAYGVGAGFDFDLGNMVVGIDAEYSDSTGDKSVTEDGETTRLKTGRDLYVGGRLGFRAGPSTLIYGKAGYTNLSLEGRISEGATGVDFDGESDGWRFGAGVEQLFGANAYGKLEYRYSDYGNFKAKVGGVDVGDIGDDVDLNRHQVVVGLGFRF
jgi:outer membrane immunogenic protein